MNDKQADEFIRRTSEITDTLESMITYLRRNQILLSKLRTYNVPPSHLEEWGEFLIDFGKALEKWGTQNRERDVFLLEVLRVEE
jgi:hypothetical protein